MRTPEYVGGLVDAIGHPDRQESAIVIIVRFRCASGPGGTRLAHDSETMIPLVEAFSGSLAGPTPNVVLSAWLEPKSLSRGPPSRSADRGRRGLSGEQKSVSARITDVISMS